MLIMIQNRGGREGGREGQLTTYPETKKVNTEDIVKKGDGQQDRFQSIIDTCGPVAAGIIV